MMLLKKATPLFTPILIELAPSESVKSLPSGSNRHWFIKDNSEIEQKNTAIKKQIKIEKYRSAFDTILAIGVSYLAANAGTAPSYFPIFSSPISGLFETSQKIFIKQNKVRPESLSEFLNYLLAIPESNRPQIRLIYHNRDEVLKLLSKVASFVDVWQKYGKEFREVKLSAAKSADNEITSFVMNNNHVPNLNRYLDGDHSILSGWAATKTAKLYDVPGDALQTLEAIISDVQQKLKSTDKVDGHFWLTFYIQLLLDRAFFTDGKQGEAYQAELLANQIGDPYLSAHCMRYCNQSLGVGAEALKRLEQSCIQFSQLPQDTAAYMMYTPSRLAAKLNRNTTMLISGRNAVDPGKFEADYLEAKEHFPAYTNIGMLASAAGIAAMVRGNKKRAVDLLTKASIEKALPIDSFNIRMNLLCAQFNYSGDVDFHEFESLCQDLKSFHFTNTWEYHRVRIASNLLTLAKDNHSKQLAWSTIENNTFLNEFKDPGNENLLREFLIKKRFLHYKDGKNLAGQFGQFCNRTGLFPCIDKDWT